MGANLMKLILTNLENLKMDMLIEAKRFHADHDTTLSLIYIDGKFECFGLEDGFRSVKVPGESRITEGKYKIKVRTHGGHHARYTKKFGFHKGMLELIDVPYFTDVLIHIGNTHEDTAGCLLIGKACNGSEMLITHSTAAYIELYSKVIDSAISGNLWIKYS